MEEMAEKFEIVLDAQESFAQMHEDGKMKKGIGGEMMQLDSVIVQYVTKPQSATKYKICIWLQSMTC